jgi:capsular polysaccharide biosynthesis protein
MTSRRYFYGYKPAQVDKLLGEIVTLADARRPPIHKLRDAIALKSIPGLFDIEGRRIDEAAARTVSPDAPPALREKVYMRQPLAVEVPKSLKVIEEPVLLGGHLMSQYGHFILESMSRLWARDLFPNLPIVFTRPGKWRDPPPYGTEVIDALGLRERMRLIEQPTLLRNVVCPDTAIKYRWRACTLVDEPHVAVADAVRIPHRRPWRRPVYLTRSGLADDLRKSEAEPELEADLAGRGFDIVRPEELSLPEQISLFEQAPLIVGTVGSAMHTALFSRSSAALAVLNWGRGFENYLLVDSVKTHTSYYLKSMKRGADARRVDIDVPLTINLLQEAALVEPRTSVLFRENRASAEHERIIP